MTAHTEPNSPLVAALVADIDVCERRLERIAALLVPCPPPGRTDGYDLCACVCTWPCPTTEAAWLAQGRDPHIEITRTEERPR